VLWLIMSVVTFYTQASITGQIAKWQNSNLFQYKPVEQPRINSKEKLAMQQKVTLYPDTLETNYFNIDSVPEMLQAYAEIVFQTVQQLSTSYGFQVDSSRNQAEHLLMMLTNEQKASDTLLTSPVERLHFRLFKNYKKWCARMVSEPLFTPNIGKKYACQIEDMLMYLLIWGEAANLRHMPECLCFLYHKTMTQHMLIRGRKINTSVYAGYFLDCVITPIYDVIVGASKQSGDHNEKKTYDDFNEFFWSPLCLQYNCFDDVNNTSVDESGTVMQNSIDTSPVAYAMKIAPKTYIEKRSWLHPLFSMHRIFEWHVITFSLLVTWAFSITLVWSWAFTYQIASFIFWEITLMNILWTCLEVWSLFPHATISGPSIYGYLLRIIAGYLVLIYQTIYFSWCFRSDPAEPGSMRAIGDSNFWWWQYVWISLLASSLYFIQSIMCWFPSITSSVMTSKSEIMQAIIQICYPMSQLYVGKVLHVSQMEVFVYIFYWLTLIAFKLWFGYRYIVFPVTVPSLELFDDYMNYEEIKFMRTAVLMFAWWFPHFMVYIIDLSIWYSVWSSMVGGFVALYERQGAVRNTDQIRANFMKLPLALCSIMIPATNSAHSSSALLGHSLSTASMTSISRTNADEAVAPVSTTAATTMKKAVSQSDLRSYQDAVVIQSLQQPDNDMLLQTKASNVFHKLDIRAERWIIFSRVWNEIIIKLRATDHISNTEMTNLMFDRYDFLSKPVYLPLYQTAGLVDSAIFTILDSYQEYNSESDAVKKFIIWDRLKTSLSHDTLEACNETWELALWVTKLLLGKTHAPDINLLAERFETWSERDEVVKMLNLAQVLTHSLTHLLTYLLTYLLTHSPNQLPDIMKHLSAIVALLNSSLAKRKKSPVVTPANIQKLNESSSGTAKASAPVATNGGTGLKKSISMGFLGDLKSNDPANDDAGKKYRKPQPFRNDFELVDLLRDALRDNFKALLQKLQLALRMSPLSKESDELIRALNMVMVSSVGWFCNDLYASTNLDEFARDTNASKIVNKLNGLLRLRHSQVELDSPEATRRLNFFVNSLFMDIPVIPTSRFCKEYTTMTPFYEEDVILTRNDLEEKNSDGISTILYLKTLYKRDWNNFLERRGFSEDQNMWSKEHLQETRIWASLRAQTLYRTVEGMMYSEAALRLLCELEHLPVEDIENIVKLKFQYVVTCQRYGHHRKEGHHKADDIDFLLARHHHLRVAYIETRKKPGDDFFSFFSVLIKHDPNAVGPVTTKEVYKIQLPGNPILGEGKPENQNHAIIFSRGRYLQAIDMNQDGYFEEFLKMRNLLQEFEHGTTIIGFREHIFTGSVSSVANYMALQELSFVTLGQRVLAKPLRIRQHYGHPDLFDKMFVMTEGGMSKASKGINLSEDVFAGFNATIRGHSVDYKEYLQVGKGRDVGLQQTYKFEAKLSQGNAEQSLSRDMNRLCDRLDFFRLMSFFYGGIGHYMANTMVMFTLVLVVYTMLNLAIYGEEGVNGRPMHPEGVLQLLLSGLGLLQTLPLMVTLTVEKGFLYMLSDIAYMILSGGPLYFIFHIQTKCYYFQHTLLAGGAIYRASGRGFVIKHTTFDDNYRFFASSHIYLGFELMVALVLFALYTTSKQYGGLTWSLWLTTISFLIGPFWFNPITFEWNKLK
jgi:callose synthase